MIPESVDDIKLIGSISKLILDDFQYGVERKSLQFAGDGRKPMKRFFSKFIGRVLRTRPYLKKDMCVGCGICRDICPAKAIVIKNKKARINRRACIRCFCCQEFCPKSAMKVQRTAIARLFHREK